MRFASLSFRGAALSAVLFGCSNDSFNGMDAGEGGAPADGAIPVVEGGGGDAGADSGADSGKPIHRVFVANGSGGTAMPLVAWDDADQLAADRAPDVQLKANLDNPTAIELAGSRLFVADVTAPQLVAFDGAGTLTSASTAAAVLPAAAFVGSGSPKFSRLLHSDPGDLLFGISGINMGDGVELLKGATTLTSSSTAAAQLGGANLGVFSAARDSMDRLFIGNGSALDIQYMNAVSGKTGTVPFTMDFAGSSFLAQAMVIDSKRLYAGGDLSGAPTVAIYELSGVHPGSQPDVVLNGANGLPSGIVQDLALENDVLSVGTAGGLFFFSNAKTLTAAAVGVPAPGNVHVNRLRVSAKTGLLYSTGQYNGMNGLQVWKDIGTASPALKAEVRTGVGPAWGLALYEP